MLEQFESKLAGPIGQIESLRNSKVMVFGAANLDMEMLPVIYQHLLQMGKVERLDVVLQSKGGEVNAARRIALLLREFTEHLCFIVPYNCESSGTILALSADEIIAGQMAIFSPIDPHLHGGDSDVAQTQSSMSFMDIQKFGQMSEEWFGLDKEEVQTEALPLLCQSIFPPTLTTFYRATLEVKQIGEELLAFQLPQLTEDQRSSIVDHLMFDYHSHGYAITREEMAKSGLNIRTEEQVELLAWQISQVMQQSIGGGLRQERDAPWLDALLASAETVAVRENRSGGFMPQWKELSVKQNIR